MNKIGLSGHFDIVKKDKDGNVIAKYGFDNLILNSGLDLVGKYVDKSMDYLDYCFVGTGNSEPNTNQINVDNQLARVRFNNPSSNKILTDDETAVIYTRKYRFDENTANGNISEIGIGEYVSNKSTLFCRTLIKSPNGNPTVITKLQGEILEVTYTLKVSVDTKDNIGMVQIGNKQYRYTARISRNNSSIYYQATAYDGNIRDINNNPSGNYVNINRQYQPYINGGYHIDIAIPFSIDQANWNTGIRSISVRSLFDWWWQVQFDGVDDNSAIPKNNTQKLNITFEQSWGRKE